MIKPNFNYRWYLKDGYPQSIDGKVTKNNYKVFGTFINGGGSTMGYKLAGYNHLGGVEIDEKTAQCYQLNHNPKFLYVEDIRKFNERNNLNDELFNLDILDGSPPCTTFSSTGKGVKTLGVKKIFKEGNIQQTLDDLVFEYANTINKLKPKVFLFENVQGILFKHNKPYLNYFLNNLTDYNKQIFLLNGANMLLPQSRPRCFIVGYLKKYELPKINLDFQSRLITFKEISDDADQVNTLTPLFNKYWEEAEQGRAYGKFRSNKKLSMNRPCFVINTYPRHLHPLYRRFMNKNETLLASSMPLDYQFINHDYNFYCGMCVPPIMTANIAYQIKLQWLDKIKH